jgi:hypothetical protein
MQRSECGEDCKTPDTTVSGSDEQELIDIEDMMHDGEKRGTLVSGLLCLRWLYRITVHAPPLWFVKWL